MTTDTAPTPDLETMAFPILFANQSEAAKMIEAENGWAQTLRAVALLGMMDRPTMVGFMKDMLADGEQPALDLIQSLVDYRDTRETVLEIASSIAARAMIALTEASGVSFDVFGEQEG